MIAALSDATWQTLITAVCALISTGFLAWLNQRNKADLAVTVGKVETNVATVADTVKDVASKVTVAESKREDAAKVIAAIHTDVNSKATQATAQIESLLKMNTDMAMKLAVFEERLRPVVKAANGEHPPSAEQIASKVVAEINKNP